jgi:hypothetical protein
MIFTLVWVNIIPPYNNLFSNLDMLTDHQGI